MSTWRTKTPGPSAKCREECKGVACVVLVPGQAWSCLVHIFQRIVPEQCVVQYGSENGGAADPLAPTRLRRHNRVGPLFGGGAVAADQAALPLARTSHHGRPADDPTCSVIHCQYRSLAQGPRGKGQQVYKGIGCSSFPRWLLLCLCIQTFNLIHLPHSHPKF